MSEEAPRPVPRRPIVLGIETSCDDTACAVLDADGRVLASVVSSQLAQYAPYGGVVPELAAREQLSAWPHVEREALARAGVERDAIDAVAATSGPGLVGSLLVGLSVGRALAWTRGLPFFAVHHLEGHLYSPWLTLEGEAAAPIPEPPAQFGTPEQIRQGQQLFGRCALCHANSDIGMTPDLRRMSPETHAAFNAIVLYGARRFQGMPQWDDVLNEEQSNAIHAFLIDLARRAFDAQQAAAGDANAN